jgi:hypothetical protein
VYCPLHLRGPHFDNCQHADSVVAGRRSPLDRRQSCPSVGCTALGERRPGAALVEVLHGLAADFAHLVAAILHCCPTASSNCQSFLVAEPVRRIVSRPGWVARALAEQVAAPSGPAAASPGTDDPFPCNSFVKHGIRVYHLRCPHPPLRQSTTAVGY